MSDQKEDISIICLCGQEFKWKVGQQEYMEQLLAEGKVSGIYQPKRCPDCAEKKRALHAPKL